MILGPQTIITNEDKIDMKNISIRWGENSYQESGFEELMNEGELEE